LLESNRALVAQVRKGFADQDAVTLDFDGHVQTCLGRPQRARIGFNRRRPGARSYKPLFALVAEPRDFVGGLLRARNAGGQHGLSALRGAWRRDLTRELGGASEPVRRSENAYPTATMEACAINIRRPLAKNAGP